MRRISRCVSRIVLFFVIILTLISCGGGGGGDSESSNTPAPTVPTVVNYSIGSPTVQGLSLINGSSSAMTFAVTNIHVTGTFNINTMEVTLPGNNGMTFTVSPDPVLKSSSVAVSILIPANGVTAQWVIGNDAAAGDFQININGGAAITVHVNTGSGTVTVTSAALSSTLSWADFTDAVTSGTQPDYVTYASLGYNGLVTIYRFAFQAYDMLKLMLENENAIQKQSPYGITETGGLPGYNSGLTITWGDADHNSAISPGDSFLFRLNNWYEPGISGGQSYIYTGRLLLVDYWNIQGSGTTTVGGDFQFSSAGVGDPHEEFSGEEVNSGTPDTGTKITMGNGGMLFTLTF
jgi:hypothetical protein